MDHQQEEFLNKLQEIDSYEFEKFVAELWELQNWETYVTKKSDDGGVDIIAEQSTPFPKKQVIQVKRYSPSNSVGRPDIQQYASIRQEQTDVDTVVVVTTGQFTDAAREVSTKLNVKLIDGSQFYNLIDALDAFQRAREYINSETIQKKTTPTDNKALLSNTSSEKTDSAESPLSITEVDQDTQIKDVPIILGSR